MRLPQRAESLRHCRPAGRRAALSYLETMVSAALISMVVIAACRVLAGSAHGLLVSEALLHGAQLADELMAEVLTQPYEDRDEPGGFGLEAGESGTSRSEFDDVDDYNGWDASPPQAKNGKQLAGYGGYRRTVVVEQVSDSDLQTVVPVGSSSFKRVTVCVYYGSRLVAKRQVVMSRNAEN